MGPGDEAKIGELISCSFFFASIYPSKNYWLILFFTLKFPQCQYDLLPPSLARFSPTDADVIVYTGYGLDKCVQFYSISRKIVFRSSSLTHWPMALDVSPHGHLLAFGCQGIKSLHRENRLFLSHVLCRI